MCLKIESLRWFLRSFRAEHSRQSYCKRTVIALTADLGEFSKRNSTIMRYVCCDNNSFSWVAIRQSVDLAIFRFRIAAAAAAAALNSRLVTMSTARQLLSSRCYMNSRQLSKHPTHNNKVIQKSFDCSIIHLISSNLMILTK